MNSKIMKEEKYLERTTKSVLSMVYIMAHEIYMKKIEELERKGDYDHIQVNIMYRKTL